MFFAANPNDGFSCFVHKKRRPTNGKGNSFFKKEKVNEKISLAVLFGERYKKSKNKRVLRFTKRVKKTKKLKEN